MSMAHTAPSVSSVPASAAGAGSSSTAQANGNGHGKKAALASEPLLIFDQYSLYETRSKYYVLATSTRSSHYRILKIDRSIPSPPSPSPPPSSFSEPAPLESAKVLESEGDNENWNWDWVPELDIVEDAGVYTKAQARGIIASIEAASGGKLVNRIRMFFGIVGFVRFTSGYYMMCITRSSRVAVIGGHEIRHIDGVEVIQLTDHHKSAIEQKMYAAFLHNDLTKNHYFSYTYDLTCTLQRNLTTNKWCDIGPKRSWGFVKSFVWNHHMLKNGFGSSRHTEGNPWVLPVIYGFVDQAKLSVFGKNVYVTLIARRSRYYAGARFLRRGVDAWGHVANFVETEQIVSDPLLSSFIVPNAHDPVSPGFTAHVQVRGSIPVQWSQENASMNLKPPISLGHIDPFYVAAGRHFNDIFERYGAPVIILNLVKSHERQPRESKLLNAYTFCVEYLNQFLPQVGKIEYIAWDIAAANKAGDEDVIGVMEDIAQETLSNTGFFHSGPEPRSRWLASHKQKGGPPYRDTILLQRGVARVNCIDCIDRTNSASFMIAKAALCHQLYALGYLQRPFLSFDCDTINMFTEMYHDLGDTIALQYGGSNLVNRLDDYDVKIRGWTSHSRNMIEGFKRYYANSFIDAEKQVAMDLFLGVTQRAAVRPVPTPPKAGHYMNWYDSEFVHPHLTIPQAEANMRENVKRLHLGIESHRKFTRFQEMFEPNMNSSSKYWNDKRAERSDLSPFKSRRSTRKGRGGNLFGMPALPWGMVDAPRASAAKPQRRATSAALSREPSNLDLWKEVPVSDVPANLDAPLVDNLRRFLNPRPYPEELVEYEDYVKSVTGDTLLLSLELSEMDTLVYRQSVAVGKGELGLDERPIEPKSEEIYRDFVRQAKDPSAPSVWKAREGRFR
ncbi:hypothetical protein BT69DRAFT_1247299 [Atractiella rhizophila]|nr:hypothetical protein BT69DRAFT_1247299 [Atractiella rhizophila]